MTRGWRTCWRKWDRRRTFIIQQIIARYNLKSFKDIGFEKVEVEVAKDACPVCRRMAGKRFRIEEAAEEQATPNPCHDCSTEGRRGHQGVLQMPLLRGV